jgi:hypothetical protein
LDGRSTANPAESRPCLDDVGSIESFDDPGKQSGERALYAVAESLDAGAAAWSGRRNSAMAETPAAV